MVNSWKYTLDIPSGKRFCMKEPGSCVCMGSYSLEQLGPSVRSCLRLVEVLQIQTMRRETAAGEVTIEGWMKRRPWTGALRDIRRLTLVVDVLVLVHFSVHVRVCVRVDVCEDLWVDLGAEQELLLLLLTQVLLVAHGAHAVLVGSWQWPLSRRLAVAVGLGRDDGSWGTVLFRLAEPQENGAQDEDHASRDADDDGPGEPRRRDGRSMREVGLGV